jgi:hypothetical protein
MKVGDLVRCNMQPGVRDYDPVTKKLLPMKHVIKGEVGMLIEFKPSRHGSQLSKYAGGWIVMFSHLDYYTHYLAPSALEVISATNG